MACAVVLAASGSPSLPSRPMRLHEQLVTLYMLRGELHAQLVGNICSQSCLECYPAWFLAEQVLELEHR
jgi:hypothetical protein